MTTDSHRRISNSEATDFNTCKRLYYNSYIRMLAPKTLSGPLAIGSVGHLVFEDYFKARQGGMKHNDALSLAMSILPGMLRSEAYTADSIIAAEFALQKYFQHWGSHDDWEILATERKYEMKIPGRKYSYAMKLDILVRDLNSGMICLVDNKFTYNFWNADKAGLRAQFPRYLAALRHNGLKIDAVIINQVRYRKDAREFVTRSYDKINNNKIRRLVQEYIVTADEIMEFRALPPDQQELKATRLLVEPICKGCAFKDLCQTELVGGFTGTMLKTDFKLNEYAAGYNPVEAMQSGPSIEDQLAELL